MSWFDADEAGLVRAGFTIGSAVAVGVWEMYEDAVLGADEVAAPVVVVVVVRGRGGER